MKIQKVKFFQFRNVPDMEKQINGANILLLAENTKGKSNFIKGLQSALCGTLGPNAIRDGKEKAEIEIQMSDFENETPVDGTEYTFKLVVKKDKEGKEKSTIEVHAPNGFKETKKTIIGTIAGEIEIPHDFVEMSKTDRGKKDQLEIIKSLFPSEVREQLALFENKSSQAYEERTEVNREIKAIEGWLNTQGYDREMLEKYANESPVDISSINVEMRKAIEINQKIGDVNSRMTIRNEQIQKDLTEIRNLELKIEGLRKSVAQAQEQNSQAQIWLKSNPEIPTTEFESKIDEATRRNQMIEKAKTMDGQMKTLASLKDRSGDLTALYESTKQAIQDAIRDIGSPIEGMTFDESNCYFNGKLIHPDQLSTSEIMDFEIRLLIAQREAQKESGKAMADVLFVERGESFGMKKLVELQKVAQANGYQIIMEQVERGTEELKIEIMPTFTN